MTVELGRTEKPSVGLLDDGCRLNWSRIEQPRDGLLNDLVTEGQ